MADAVTTKVIQAGGKHRIIQITNVCDGTGEANVIKVDVSTLTKSDGTVPTRTRIKEVLHEIQGFSYVKLHWDANTDDTAMLLVGNGYRDYHGIGGLIDPQSTGFTGDLLLTTASNASGNTYDITLVVELI